MARSETARPLVIAAPEPRTLDLIFRPEALARLRAERELVECPAAEVGALPRDILARARFIIGQPPLSREVFARLADLRCVFNVEGNLFLNMPYDDAFARGVHVVTPSAVFAAPVAEMGLGMALDLARGITDADIAFREGREIWGLEGAREARLIGGSDVGIIGFGDLGRAVSRLLSGFGARVRAHDPWLPDATLRDGGVGAATLEAVLAESDFLFVTASATSRNQGFLGAEAFARMRPGAAVILLSRAGIVDFDALVDAVRSGRIVAASDVFPEEPMPADHPVRTLPGFLRSAHRAGALAEALLAMGDMVLDDMDLIDRGLPPVRCKRAERETVSMTRSKPVEKT